MAHRFTAVLILALVGAAGCGGGKDGASSTARPVTTAPPAAAAAASSAPAPACRKVPRTTVRLIASHGNRKTHFQAGAAAAVHVGSGYAVSLPAFAGGSRRMATWFVDDLRAPSTVTSGNVEALQITNWPLDTLGAEPVRQSQICATQALRGPGPLAP
jgi:hypothetical protein